MPFESLTAVLNLDSSGFTSGIEDAEDGMGSLQDRAASTGKSMQRAGGAMTAGVTAPLAAMGSNYSDNFSFTVLCYTVHYTPVTTRARIRMSESCRRLAVMCVMVCEFGNIAPTLSCGLLKTPAHTHEV